MITGAEISQIAEVFGAALTQLPDCGRTISAVHCGCYSPHNEPRWPNRQPELTWRLEPAWPATGQPDKLYRVPR